MHHTLRIAAALFLVATSALADSEVEGTPVALKAGEKRVLTFEGISQLMAGDPSVVDVRSLGTDQVELQGKATGRTTLVVWKKSGQSVRVAVAVTGTGAPERTPATEEPLALKVGEERLLANPGVIRVAVGDPAVAEVLDADSAGVRVKGATAGETVLLVWTKDGRGRAYRITVKP